METRLCITQDHEERTNDEPQCKETRLGTGKPTAHAEVPGEGVRAVKAQPCTLFHLTGTKLNISEQNTTAVSEATFIETY